MLNLLSPITITEPYTKVIVIKIDDFESTIIDERNFSPSDVSGIEDFKNLYDDIDTVCLERLVK
jgi:hypothetical protein